MLSKRESMPPHYSARYSTQMEYAAVVAMKLIKTLNELDQRVRESDDHASASLPLATQFQQYAVEETHTEVTVKQHTIRLSRKTKVD